MDRARDAEAVRLFASWAAGWLVTPWEARASVLGVSHDHREAFGTRWTGRRRTCVVRSVPPERAGGALHAPPDPSAVDPWTRTTPDELFSQSLRRCHCPTCLGERRVACPECAGDGRVPCDECGGSGLRLSNRGDRHVDCRRCRGDGTRRCRECSGGKVRCDTCDGKGQVDCWLAIEETSVTTDLWSGDDDLVEVLSKPAADPARHGIQTTAVWKGPLGDEPAPVAGVLNAHPTLRVRHVGPDRYDAFELRRAEGVLSTVRFRLAGADGSLRVVTAAGLVDPAQHATTPFVLRLAAIGAAGAVALGLGLLATDLYASTHAWYAATENVANLRVASAFLALAAAVFAAVAILPRPNRDHVVPFAAALPVVVLAGMTALFVGSDPSLAHARTTLAAGDADAALAEARACVDLQIDSPAAGAFADKISLARVESSPDTAACWVAAAAPWANPEVQRRAEQTCFERTITRADAEQAAGNYAVTRSLLANLPAPLQAGEEVQRRLAENARAAFDACVRADDAACMQRTFAQLHQSVTPQELDDARRRADQAAHRLLDAGWSAITNRRGSLESRANKCAEIQLAITLLTAVGSPNTRPTVEEYTEACAKLTPTPADGPRSASLRALNLVSDGWGLATAKGVFPNAQPEYAKETDSTYAADIYIGSENSFISFTANGDKINNVSIQSVKFDIQREWLGEVCAWADLQVRRYETPSAPGIEEVGCYAKTFVATCVDDLGVCLLVFAPNGLPKSIPTKREIK